MSNKTHDRSDSRLEPVDWGKRIVLLVGIPVALCVIYAGVKYPVPWLWRHAGIFSILLIPVWLAVVGGLGFLLGAAVPILLAAVTRVVLLAGESLLRLGIDVILFLPTVVTNSPCLYARMSPALARGLLGCSSRGRRTRVLNRLRPEDVSRILVVKGGLSLLARLSVTEQRIVLGGFGPEQIHGMLQMIGVERYPEFVRLLREISPEKLQGHLYYETFTRRAQEVEILSKLGIEVDPGTDRKPYQSRET